jgi:hypothetical protein
LAVSHAGTSRSSGEQDADTLNDLSRLQRAVVVGDAAPVGPPPWLVAVRLISSDLDDTLTSESASLDKPVASWVLQAPERDRGEEEALGRGGLSRLTPSSSLHVAAGGIELGGREGCVKDGRLCGGGGGGGGNAGQKDQDLESRVVWIDSKRLHLLQGK